MSTSAGDPNHARERFYGTPRKRQYPLSCLWTHTNVDGSVIPTARSYNATAQCETCSKVCEAVIDDRSLHFIPRAFVCSRACWTKPKGTRMPMSICETCTPLHMISPENGRNWRCRGRRRRAGTATAVSGGCIDTMNDSMTLSRGPADTASAATSGGQATQAAVSSGHLSPSMSELEEGIIQWDHSPSESSIFAVANTRHDDIPADHQSHSAPNGERDIEGRSRSKTPDGDDGRRGAGLAVGSEDDMPLWQIIETLGDML